MFDRVRQSALALPRAWKRAATVGFDIIALAAVLWVSYALRLGGSFAPNPSQLLIGAAALVIAVPVFIRMGLYRAVIRYLPERTILTIVQAMLLTSTAWAALLFLTAMYGINGAPRSVPVLFFALGSVVIAGSRFALKRWLGVPPPPQPSAGHVLIYGANDAGIQLASALSANGAARVAAFIDDDPAFHGRDLVGHRVHPPAALEGLIRNMGVTEVIISLPQAPAARRHEIYEMLSAYPVKIRTLPAIADLAAGKYAVGALREIDIDDLLGRSSVPADPELLRQMIEGRVIMVSGAGGSIGSELTRLIARWDPRRLVLLEANEFALYETERRLQREGDVEIVPVLGSVGDDRLVRRILAREGVEAVFHAAAYKHVPLLEANVLEGVRNNVFGTATLARAALDAGVGQFVLISTDKAVHPSSVMGATKRWAEMIILDCAARARRAENGARFCAVRFGNVLGSNGSVVPLFKEQIAGGGPVTLTDDAMTRYFMSVHEAAELIVQAGALSEGGDFFLLEMGAPIAIRTLAENMIRLAGLSVRSPSNPGGDIEIRTVGARPGEKLVEELFYDPAQVTRTRQPKILRARRVAATHDVDTALAELAQAVERADEAEARRQLFAFVLQNELESEPATGT
ncbi:MAG: nucleoside-diphosphate sugar epimerase/dehydratase [Devosia sp.]|nr:nucleoside-diphosphate sugar epimerase/dehydratase [Devosia sp.]